MAHQVDDDVLELAERVRAQLHDRTDYRDVAELTTGSGTSDGPAEALFHLTTRDGTDLEVVVRQRRRR